MELRAPKYTRTFGQQATSNRATSKYKRELKKKKTARDGRVASSFLHPAHLIGATDRPCRAPVPGQRETKRLETTNVFHPSSFFQVLCAPRCREGAVPSPGPPSPRPAERRRPRTPRRADLAPSGPGAASRRRQRPAFRSGGGGCPSRSSSGTDPSFLGARTASRRAVVQVTDGTELPQHLAVIPFAFVEQNDNNSNNSCWQLLQAEESINLYGSEQTRRPGTRQI